ncbi:DUF3024 domain-containing protein [Rheinheimera salexigens]|uniref:DUF3024 domain-containing protein n=1 Tax=Rheinheimera salexigens TaxID=1628148 RepID=A0A1E7Q7Y1_9GAMM|nr:DUF3024 domain-containing protein [Rheinheimera salexigens]OEY70220.1 hypothetical protein BI198_12085 [Rheinheimera salexigens]
MAFSEFEHARVEKFATTYIQQNRPPLHMRDQLDIGYRIKEQSIEFFEIRPRLNNKSTKIEQPIAKATHIKQSKTWQIFWLRQDLKWHSYDPVPEVSSFEEFLAVLAEDAHGCFRG